MRKARRVVQPRRRLFRGMESLEERTLLSVTLDTSAGISFAGTDTLATTVFPVGAATVTIVPVRIDATTGAAFTGDVGKISGLSPTTLPRLHGLINWGDLPTASSAGVAAALSTATFTFDTAGVLHVGGTHTYSQPGTYPVTVNITLAPPAGTLGPSQLFVIHSQAVVAGDSLGGITISAAAGHSFTAIVGKFNLPPIPLVNPVAPVLKASINWGDGNTSIGTIVPLPTTDPSSSTFAYGVQGTHTYTAGGTYPIVVTVYQQYPFVGPTPLSSADPSLIRLITTIHSTAIVLLPPSALG